jgi:hypothetical protein
LPVHRRGPEVKHLIVAGTGIEAWAMSGLNQFSLKNVPEGGLQVRQHSFHFILTLVLISETFFKAIAIYY